MYKVVRVSVCVFICLVSSSSIYMCTWESFSVFVRDFLLRHICVHISVRTCAHDCMLDYQRKEREREGQSTLFIFFKCVFVGLLPQGYSVTKSIGID